MTKDTMALVMENCNYILDRIMDIKTTPAQGPIFDIVIKKGLNQ
ncbi:hypothetical protein [Desulforamulus aquiferis]|uniref:Uncharacterized protein n=1 Tax=Desulforamulus aquiferis TaxID=1397668 RepID=A0AAW7ZIU9_9FIRM|nr:hypothetical protein [Desulforamulus aquiferis]MDO7789056.1 hypothetical protein [Desulforamulus aquiferis]